MSDSSGRIQLSLQQELLIDAACERLEADWKCGVRPRLEELVRELPDTLRASGATELVRLELAIRRAAGEVPTAGEYAQRLPNFGQLIGDLFAGQLFWPPLDEFVQRLTSSGLVATETAARYRWQLPARCADETAAFSKLLMADGKLTDFQLQYVLRGEVDRLLFDDYVLTDRLGKGGMGEVFKGRHRRMDRVVAIKVLSSRGLEVPSALARFQQEVRAAARLSHPNVVTAYDCRERQGQHYLVLEFVEGMDLGQLVHRGGPLTLSQVLVVLHQAARGLRCAHAQGVVHRDIKPSNLMVNRQGVVKILDMGLARIQPVSGSDEWRSLTEANFLFGTLPFMAPEQAENSHGADARADVYSLGCTLFYLLAGRPPFAGETPVQKILAHREQPAPPLVAGTEKVPVALEKLYQRMLAKQPELRPTLDEVLTTLRTEFPAATAEEASCQELASALLRPGFATETTEFQSTVNVAQNSAEFDTARRLAIGAATKGTSPPSAPRAGNQPAWRRAAILVGVTCAVLIAGAMLVRQINKTNPPVTAQQEQPIASNNSPAVPNVPADPFANRSIVQLQNAESQWYLDFGGLRSDLTKSIVIAAPEASTGTRWRIEALGANEIRLQSVDSGWYLECMAPVTSTEPIDLLKAGQCEIVNAPIPGERSKWQIVDDGQNACYLKNSVTGCYLDYRGPRTAESKRDVLAEPRRTGGGVWRVIATKEW